MNFDHDGKNIEYEVLWYLEQMGLYTPKKDETVNNEQTNVIQNKIENNTNIDENII